MDQIGSPAVMVEDGLLYASLNQVFDINRNFELLVDTESPNYEKVFKEYDFQPKKSYSLLNEKINFEHNRIHEKACYRMLHYFAEEDPDLLENSLQNVVYEGMLKNLVAFVHKNGKLNIFQYKNFKTIAPDEKGHNELHKKL